VLFNVVVFQLRPYAKNFFSSKFHLKDFTMPTQIPFLPQEGISQQILQGLAQANQEHADQLAAQARQKQLAIAQQEANTASQRLATETPLINAQVSEAQARARAAALAEAQQKRVADYISGDSSDSQPHPLIPQVIGNQFHPDVPLTAPQPAPQAQPLTISDPTGQQLAVPAPPVATAPISTDASQAPPQTGPIVPPTPAQPRVSGVDRDTAELVRLAGGVTPSEHDAIIFARQQLDLNPTHDGLINYLNTVHGIIQKRNDPTVAASVAFQRAGLSEAEANAAAVRNTNIAAQLDKMDADPSVLSDKAPTAIAQLKGLLNTPNLTPDVRAHIQRNLVVAQNAQKNDLAFIAAKKKTEDDIANGNPKLLAQLLVSGDAAWSQLVSTRKPEVLVAVAMEAKRLDPNFSIAVNEANYKRATDPQVRNTLDLIQSMTDRNGSIAIAEKAAQKLPQLNSQQANAVFNAFSRSFGNNSVTNFHTAMLGLADEYSKVLGGGVSSDTGRAQALDILKDAYSSNQLSGAIDTMKADINARKSELIRGNQTLERTYGAGGSKTEPAASTTGGLSTGASNYLNSIGVKH
jgi:hypothetical protein